MTKSFFPVESLERVQSTTKCRLLEWASEVEPAKALKIIVVEWTFYKLLFSRWNPFHSQLIDASTVITGIGASVIDRSINFHFLQWKHWIDTLKTECRGCDSKKYVCHSECGMSWMLQFREPFNQSRVIGALPHCREPHISRAADNVGRAK